MMSGSQSDCVDCHMPEEKLHVADNFNHLPKRKLRFPVK